MWNVLIVDDEAPIRSELRYLLKDDARIESFSEAGSVASAVERIAERQPDIIFLDISMPWTSGLVLAKTLQAMKSPPAIIFVTAYSEYAIEAFEIDAVDYVLKPLEEERLAIALRKAERYLARARTNTRDVMIPVTRSRGRTYIPARDLIYVKATGDYARLYAHSGEYLVACSLSALEQRLGNDDFLRVHKSYIVNLEEVHTLRTTPSGGMELVLGQGDQVVPVSRRKVPVIKRALGIDLGTREG